MSGGHSRPSPVCPLQRIRGPEATASGAVETEIAGILETVAVARATSVVEQLQQRHVLWSVCIGVVIAFFQQVQQRRRASACPGIPLPATFLAPLLHRPSTQWCGTNAVNAYAPEILGADVSPSKASTQSIYIGLSKVIFVSLTLVIMDRVGRRPLLIGGSLLLVCFLVMCATSMMASVHAPKELTVVSLFLYMCGAAGGGQRGGDADARDPASAAPRPLQGRL